MTKSSFIQRRLTDSKALSAALVIALVGQIALGSIAQAAVLDANDVSTAMTAFRLGNTSVFSQTIAGQQSGAGSFSNGSVSDYPEGACIPGLVLVKNKTKTTAGDIVFSPSFDYLNGAVGIDHLEAVTSSLGSAVGTADDLSDLTLGLADLSTVTSFATLSGGSVSAVITGPVANGTNGGTQMKKYDVTLQNVPAGETVLFLTCARLGTDASEFNGATLSMRLSGGNENIGISTNQLLVLPSLTLIKEVVGSDASADQWSFNVSPSINGQTNFPTTLNQDGTASVTIDNIPVDGSYSVTESGPTGYVISLGADSLNCSLDGDTAYGSVAAGKAASNNASLLVKNATCVFVNTYDAPPQPTTGTLTVIKKVVGSQALPSSFTLKLSINEATPSTFQGADEPGTQTAIDIGAGYSVTEDTVTNYTTTYSETGCSGTMTAQGATCTVTNTYQTPPPPPEEPQTGRLTVVKVVINNDAGTAQVSDFPLFIGEMSVTSGETNVLTAGNYVVSETSSPDYVGTFSGDCDVNGAVSLEVGDQKTCTITNDDRPQGGGNPPSSGTLIVVTKVINDDGGTAMPSSFLMTVGDGISVSSTFGGVDTPGIGFGYAPGAYVVNGSASPSYTQSKSANCSGTMLAGQTVTCVVTYDDMPATGGSPTPPPEEPPAPQPEPEVPATPAPVPQVLGATDTDLPVTGMPAWTLASVLLAAAPFLRRKRA